MDEKTARTTRAKVYIAFAVLAVIMIPFIGTSLTRLIALAALAVYCLIMAYDNVRKAKEEDGK